MCKQQYLPFNSNHPAHIFKSLPYSQGLRIIRLCSIDSDKELKLRELMSEFLKCGYPDSILNQCLHKLKNVSRKSALTPKTHLLLSNLSIHTPHILSLFDIKVDELILNIPHESRPNVIFLSLPFYKSIPNLGKVAIETILIEAANCTNVTLKNYVLGSVFKIAFTIHNSLGRLIA